PPSPDRSPGGEEEIVDKGADGMLHRRASCASSARLTALASSRDTPVTASADPRLSVRTAAGTGSGASGDGDGCRAGAGGGGVVRAFGTSCRAARANVGPATR